MEMMQKLFPKEAHDQYVAALVAGNLPAVKRMVEEHAVDVRLHYQKKSAEDGEEPCTRDYYGNPLNIAAFAKQEAVALYLFENGAKHEAGSEEIESALGWDTCDVHPIEIAMSYGLDTLAMAIMLSNTPMDWSFVGRNDSDEFGGSFDAPSLFQSIAHRKCVQDNFERLGRFRGLVENKLVDIVKRLAHYDVTIDTVHCCRCDSMRDALQFVWKHLALTLENEDPVYPY